MCRLIVVSKKNDINGGPRWEIVKFVNSIIVKFCCVLFFFLEVLHLQYFHNKILGVKLLLVLIWTHY